MKQYLIQLKPLRVVLLFCALLTIILQPKLGTPASYSGWEMVQTLLMPALAPLFFMVILLDVLMATLWRTQSVGDEYLRYKRIQFADLAVVILLLIAWIPYFIVLLG